MNLLTNYLGLTLKNPVIVSSSGLTNSVSKIKKLADAGAGAVVLKSLFEEQITAEASELVEASKAENAYPEAIDYLMEYVKSNTIESYLDLIRKTKSEVDIPVIASINCYSTGEWISFARQIEEAGADALELNVFFLNTALHQEASDYEQRYYDIISQVKERVSIPVSIKLGMFFSNLVTVVDRLYAHGASGVVLFNRFYSPDIDIDKLEITSADVFSSPSDFPRVLRWVGIISGQTQDKAIDISASSGVHDAQTLIKMLLAGANTVQVCSAVYQNGPEVITAILAQLEEWMEKKGFKSTDEFRGKLSYKQTENSVLYERSQFMKYFSSRD